MAYIEPLVMVYQEYASLSTTTQTAQLPACIVGPCYQVVDTTDKEALVPGGYNGDLEDAAIPNVAPGALIDAESMVFRFKNPVVKLTATPITPASTELNEIQCSEETFPQFITVGDTVTFSGDENEGEWKVYSVDKDAYSFLLNKEIPAAGTETSTTELTVLMVGEMNADQQAVYDNLEVSSSFAHDDAWWEVLDIDREAGKIVVARSEQEVPVDAVALPGTLRTEEVTNESPVALTFDVFRKIEDVELKAGDEGAELIVPDVENYTFDASRVEVSIDGQMYPITSAELYVGYRALRQDVNDVNAAYTVDEIKAYLGKIDPRNPLAYGVNIALANSSDTGVYFVGVLSDDLAGYTDAKDKLESFSPLYAIVPLTQNVGILNVFKLHAEAMSEAEAGQWRIAIGNTKMPDSIVLAESNTDPEVGDLHKGTISEDGSGDLCWLKDKKGGFLAAGCGAGDTIIVTKGGTEYEFTVESVPTDDIITVVQTDDFGDRTNSPFVADDVVEYRVVHSFAKDKEGQAQAIAAASKAFGSRRFVHVWPDICVIDGEAQPGYYLCCAVAGAISSLQPHYGLTRLSIAGIEAVKNSGDRFNRSQLNTIAGGGTFIFYQETPNSVPYIRHQLTTDYGTIEFQEVSFVKNFDYVCYVLKDVLQQYIGRWNITPSTLAAISDSIKATLAGIAAESYPKIGSPILSYDNVYAVQSDLSRDRVEAFCDVTFPYPLNTLAVHVISQ